MNDPRARERYDAEVTRTKEISDKVVRDAREARDESVRDHAALQRIVDMSIEHLIHPQSRRSARGPAGHDQPARRSGSAAAELPDGCCSSPPSCCRGLEGYLGMLQRAPSLPPTWRRPSSRLGASCPTALRSTRSTSLPAGHSSARESLLVMATVPGSNTPS